jgi:hypothetical protein
VIRELEMPVSKDMAPDDTGAKPAEAVPRDFSEELEGAAERVRNGLQEMSARLIEVGREIGIVKGRLTRAQFLSWSSLACGLSPRNSRSMMRAAELALSVPSQSRSVRSEKLTAHIVKDMIRAVKGREATSNKKDVRREDVANRSARSTCAELERHPVRRIMNPHWKISASSKENLNGK